ncbi:MAG: hypothetical protein QNJ07_06785 [Woeseiaceae bacterium]|nr:hypothetical protein [Woeseiaceae bacterium]
MSVVGRFLEFGVHTSDIIESLHFYRTLGFADMEIGDIWTHKYAVLGDGEFNVALHDREFDGPAITFVHPDLARHARSMADHGFDFRFLRLDEDVFNELGFKCRDGHLITMQEARTFTPVDEYENDSLCGSLFEISLPVRDTIRAAAFWAPIAPVMLDMREEPTPHMRFDAGGVPVGLSESIALTAPSLCFKCRDKDALRACIDADGLEHTPFPGYEGAFVALHAPEGTTLFVFDEDFLGESYEVEEDGDPDDFDL